jgi:hypothetical protein
MYTYTAICSTASHSSEMHQSQHMDIHSSAWPLYKYSSRPRVVRKQGCCEVDIVTAVALESFLAEKPQFPAGTRSLLHGVSSLSRASRHNGTARWCLMLLLSPSHHIRRCFEPGRTRRSTTALLAHTSHGPHRQRMRCHCTCVAFWCYGSKVHM